MNYRKNLLGLCGLLMACLATCLVMGGVAEAATADSYEADDSFATAGTIADGEVQSRSIHVVGDQDFIKFTLNERSDVLIEAESVSGSIMLTIHDGPTSFFNLSPLALHRFDAGVYYIEASSWLAGETIDSYTLSFKVTPLPAAPTIEMSSSVISVSCSQGADSAADSFAIGNSTGGTLNYSISDDASWLSCSPSAGAITGFDTDVITINYNTSELDVGDYTATIFVYDPGASNSPRTVPVELSVRTADSFEIDDSFVTANIITDCELQAHTLHLNNDKDYVSFVLSELSDVAIRINSTRDNVALGLYNSSQVQIASDSTSIQGSILVREEGLSAGTYYLEVEKKSPNDLVDSYELGFWVEPALAADSYEADDDFVTATGIADGEVQTHSIHVVGDKDYFQFTLMEKMDVVIAANSSIPTLSLRLYDGIQSEIADNYDEMSDLPSDLSLQGLAAGTYYVLANEQYSDDVINIYTLSLNTTPTPSSPSIEVSNSDFFDWCSQGDDDFSMELRIRNSSGGILNYVFSSDAPWLSCSPASGTSTGEEDVITMNVSVSELAAGEHSATVFIVAPGALNSPQTVSVTLVVVAPDIYESDDTFETASSIAEGVMQHRSIHEVDDSDYISFTLTEMSAVVIEAATLFGPMPYKLYDNTQTLIAETPLAWGVNELDAGVYYIQVEAFMPIDLYTLSLSTTTLLPDSYEEDDSFATAKTIDDDTVQNRSIHAVGNLDFVSFTLSETSNVFVDIEAPTSGFSLRLYDSTYTLIAIGSSGWPINETGFAAGTYYIEISYLFMDGHYPYSLTFDAYTLSPDNYESDDTFETASSIAEGVMQHRSIHEVGDKDYVSFVLAEKSDVVIDVCELPANVILSLYDSSRILIASSERMFGVRAELRVTGIAAGTYYILVEEHFNDDTNVFYRLNLNTTPVAPLPTIALNKSVITDICNQGTDATSDSFTVRNSTGGTLSYDINVDETWLSCSPASGVSTGEVDTITVDYDTSLLATGVYTATISITDSGALNSPQTVEVELWVTGAPVTDSYEADDGFGAASGITSGSVQSRSIHVAGDKDYVAFTLSETSDVVIETNGPLGDTVLYLYDGAQSLIMIDHDGGAGAFSLILASELEAGTYYIVVEDTGNDDTISVYTLSLEAIPVATTPGSSGGGCSASTGSSDGVLAGSLLLMAMCLGLYRWKRRYLAG